jgi:hypothetical protein
MTADSKQAYFPYQIRRFGRSKPGRFLLHFLELQIPMGLGALVCYLLVRLISASSRFAALYHPGTFLFAVGDVLYLAVPVAVWMSFRGYGWRYSLELALAMIAPVAMIMMLGPSTEYDYLTWLLVAGYPVMCLGMFVYMLYRRNHFTEPAGHRAHIKRTTSSSRS